MLGGVDEHEPAESPHRHPAARNREQQHIQVAREASETPQEEWAEEGDVDDELDLDEFNDQAIDGETGRTLCRSNTG